MLALSQPAIPQTHAAKFEQGVGPLAICGVIARSVAELERLVGKRAGVAPQGNHEFAAYPDPLEGRFWSFTKAGHPAHPAVACRTAMQAGGGMGVQTDLKCFASKQACDKLAKDYAELDKRLKAYIAGQR